MKATELIETQHRLVEKLFNQFERAEGDERSRIFDEIAKNLVGHDAIERELFYPACEQELGEDDDALGESLVEHGVVEFCIFRADKNRRSDEFEKYVKVLKETVMHHVKEEEDELLPRVEKEFDEQALEELGTEMEERFEQALKADFRKPLRENLQQVLAGRTKTSKRAPAPRARKSSSASKRGGRQAPAPRSGTRSGSGTRRASSNARSRKSAGASRKSR